MRDQAMNLEGRSIMNQRYHFAADKRIFYRFREFSTHNSPFRTARKGNNMKLESPDSVESRLAECHKHECKFFDPYHNDNVLPLSYRTKATMLPFGQRTLPRQDT